MMALTTPAGLALWQFLGGIDMATKVTFGLAHPDDPLRWALTDINAVSYTALGEFLWVRILDVEAALSARARGPPTDRWCSRSRTPRAMPPGASHRDRRAAGDRHAHRRAPARSRVDAETLGSLYLGGANVSAMRRAGRVAGTDEAVERFARMADLAVPPYNLTGF